MTGSKILYTHTDEAPALATYSLLPIVEAFAGAAGITVETRDISLAGRILAAFPDYLSENQRVNDDLLELGQLSLRPEANIIKLPNVSAAMPQLRTAIAELQANGFQIPEYPNEPSCDEDRSIKARYDKIRGSAVNPVLREGNSDRRAPKAVKEYAKSHPHSMGAWSRDSKTHVATMTTGDFRSNEKSVTIDRDGCLRIELDSPQQGPIVLKSSVATQVGQVIDGTFMSKRALLSFLAEQIADAKKREVLFSLHLKATMMKISDPIIFGHAVRVYFADVFSEHGDTLTELGVDPNSGWASILAAIATLPEDRRSAVECTIRRVYDTQPAMAMVDSDKGITNLHVPSDVIVDASMPAMIRASGQMWNAAGNQVDCKAVIPDSSYAGIYAVAIADCREHGAFNPATMGSVPNVGLMAQAAEEYGSHDRTFEIPASGTVRVIDDAETVLMEFNVEQGDIWRMCDTHDLAIRDWVRLAVSRARATGTPAVFWLDQERPHDAELITKVRAYLKNHDTDGLAIEIMSPIDATRFSLERIRLGLDTISVTGNVLRDYNTDLFPILELGTSAKMLSIVPLMNGGGLFETGAGGSAPKHVQQFLAENYLRWDSLGEFLALAVSFEHLGELTGNASAKVLASTLDTATGRLLDEDKSSARRLGQIDNRGSHCFLALFWAEALASQTQDSMLGARFAPIAAALSASQQAISDELIADQGHANDIGGYYMPDPVLAAKAMRPSPTFNAILATLADS